MNKFAVITAGRESGGGGAFIAENPAERRAVADDLRRAMDAAAEFGISRIGTCPLNDGADTLFFDYARAYDSAAETFGAACVHNPAIKICIEYKKNDTAENFAAAFQITRQLEVITDRIDIPTMERLLKERNLAKTLPYLYSLLQDALFSTITVGSIRAPRLKHLPLRSRYEITYTSFSISLRLLMPFRNVSAHLILLQRLTSSG